ncbi:hypothetical protein HGA91_02815 [candidate division WWE3 bacterium]|nr:hypothetical protein [candidate division WWE3 bacterium]
MNWLTQKRFLYLSIILVVFLIAILSIGYIFEFIPADEFQSYVYKTVAAAGVFILTAGIITFFARPQNK